MPFRTFKLIPLFLALGGTVLAAPVQAQSLSELLEAARGYDAAWQSARAQLDASTSRAEQARAGLLPSVRTDDDLDATAVVGTSPLD